MNKQLLMAINQICAERNLKPQVVIDAVEQALASAYRRNFAGGGAVTAKLDPETGDVRVYSRYEVTTPEEILDPKAQLTPAQAAQIDPSKTIPGDIILIERTPDDFGRIAAQTAKQVILQRIREAERDAVFDEYSQREGELVQGTIRTIDYGANSVIVSLDGGRVEGVLGRADQLPGERYRANGSILAYVTEVTKGTRGPLIHLSRTHRNMLRRLLEKEVPEIKQGTVEIKAIAREAGSRSKIAVTATQPGVDPVGSCVGMRGVRVQNIVNELNGEKIDVIEWYADAERFVGSALSPARVVDVLLFPEDDRTAVVIVPDNQLSLAIGKEGQNARLVAKLTGWRIDIKSEAESISEGLDETERQRIRLERKARMQAGDLIEAAKRLLSDVDEVALDEVETAPPVVEDEVGDLEPAPGEVPTEVVETVEPEVSEPTAPVPEIEEEIDLAARLESAMSSIIDDGLLPPEEEDEEGSSAAQRKKQRRKDRALVFDEEAGRLVAVKKRKRGSGRVTDFYEEDV